MAGVTRRRLVGEALLVPFSVLVAWFVARLDVAGCVLVGVTVAVAIVVAHLVPTDDLTAWPPLAPPERGGRRAEIYRLSWQLDANVTSSRVLVRRVRSLAAALEREATPAEQAALASAVAALEASQSVTAVAAAVTEIERTAAAVEQRAQLAAGAARSHAGHQGTR